MKHTPAAFLLASLVAAVQMPFGFGREAMAQNPRSLRRPNVLFVVVDDLNCRIGCYGDPLAKTPNLDRLAMTGVRFDRAYCQFPVCNPSRTSVLTGRHPASTGVLDNNTWLVLEDGQMLLPRWFEAHGYRAVECGKIWHGPNDGTRHASSAGLPTEVPGWFTPTQRAEQQRLHPDYWIKTHSPYRNDDVEAASYAWANGFGPLGAGVTNPMPVSSATTPLAPLLDTHIADEAIASLGKLSADTTTPFFLSVGLTKPHVPLKCPREFFDLYDAATIPLPPDFATEPTGPEGTPPDELRANIDLFTGRAFTAEEARAAIHAYLACISYMDAQLGRVLDALEKSGQRENTIVVFWGDHGWHLGEKGMWAKGTLFEVAARGPLLIADPRQTGSAGRGCRRIVQYLDIFPTLCDLAGVEPPSWLEGTSVKPLLVDPEAPWDKPALTVQTRQWFVGRSLRTERWRYTEWDEGRRGAELYDHDTDPYEMRNLAPDPAHAETLASLQKQLRESHDGQSMRRAQFRDF